MQRNSVDQRMPDTRRQWGADRRTAPHPLVPAPVSEGRIARGRLAIVLTITVWACYIIGTIIQDCGLSSRIRRRCSSSRTAPSRS